MLLNALKNLPWAGLFNVPLAAVLGYALMRLFLPPLEAGLSQQNFLQPTGDVPAPSRLDAQPPLTLYGVLQAHLFGQALAQQPSSAPPLSETLNAPETQLQLTLQGTLISEDRHYAKAIIAPANGRGEEYDIGKLLPGGAKLHDIHVDRVILEHQQQLETLPLVNAEAKSQVAITSAAVPAVSAAAGVPAAEISQSLQAYRQRIMENPAVMGQLIRINPAQQDGQFVGYTLTPGRDAQLFESAGLQAGDLLTHLNGMLLDSPMRGLSALQELAQTDYLNLQVLRNGAPLHFSFYLR